MTMIKLLRTFNSALTQQVSGHYSQRISDTYLGDFRRENMNIQKYAQTPPTNNVSVNEFSKINMSKAKSVFPSMYICMMGCFRLQEKPKGFSPLWFKVVSS